MKVGILGGGPAGLFSAWLLHQQGIDVTLFESTPEVGGISRSFQWHGFTCDLGAHRLFTTDETVLRQLLTLIPMGRYARRSQIFLAGKWVHDPVNIVEILSRYSLSVALKTIFGYFFRPRRVPVASFDSFVNVKYGIPLNRFFFSPYTEKLFGISSDQISVDWARRKVRISGPLDFLRESSKKHFSYFYYPISGGYGAIIERVYQDIRDHVFVNTRVMGLEHSEDRVQAVIYEREGERYREEFDEVISTLPLTILSRLLDFGPSVSYRGVSFVYLLINRPFVSDNHWIYFMDKEVAINRLVEFKNLSPVGQPQNRTVICAEVTEECDDVAQKVKDDLVYSGLITPDEILDTLVLHQDFGYAIYDLTYADNLLSVLETLKRFANLHLVGRSAEFKHLELDDIYAGARTLINKLVPNSSETSLAGVKQMEPSSMSPLVYGVILTFNHYDDTYECLKSLEKIEYDNFKILVVDNGSSDDTPNKVRADFPSVKVIETGRNLGVPWGYNVGFSHALQSGADYVLMLNNDTVVDPDMLQNLLNVGQEDPAAGILVPKVLYYDDPEVIWAAGGRYRIFPPAHVIVGQDRPSSEFSKPIHLEYALSCGLLIHRQAFESVGLFDPGYFFFFDDWDFSHRVHAHGLHITFVPDAQMWHKVSKSTQQSGKEAFFWKTWGESSVRFYRRHGRLPYLSVGVNVGYLMLREFFKGNGRMLKYFWEGVQLGLSKPLGAVPNINDPVLPFNTADDKS